MWLSDMRRELILGSKRPYFIKGLFFCLFPFFPPPVGTEFPMPPSALFRPLSSTKLPTVISPPPWLHHDRVLPRTFALFFCHREGLSPWRGLYSHCHSFLRDSPGASYSFLRPSPIASRRDTSQTVLLRRVLRAQQRFCERSSRKEKHQI